MKRFICTLSVLAIALICLPSCNTTKGMGQDLQKAGSGIENSAEKHGAD